ncbi:MAG: HAMP domain-containing protein [Chloroflexi bacterium]|nr:HAMP domain-containing protein [Chloroflexota bacterium]
MLYLTPAAIGYLTQFILAAAITLYLARRLPRATQRTQTTLLAAFFAATTVFVLLLFYDVALPPTQRLPAVYLLNTVVGVILIFLLQFAYHFRRLDPREKWSARIVLGLSILYTLWEAQFAIFRFVELNGGHVYYRAGDLDNALAAGFLWVPVVFVRQAIYADDRRVNWIRKLWQPHGQAAQAARGFALVFVVTLLLGLVNLYRAMVILPTSIYQLSMSVGILLALFFFAAVYIGALPETTSFMVKLAGVLLTTLLTVLGAVGWVITPVYAAQYRQPLADRQTLRFTPNNAGGYDVTRAPFRFDRDLGREVAMPTRVEINSVPVDFDFLYFGRASRTVYVTNLGAVTMGQALAQRDVQYGYGTTPAIFALATFLSPGAGVFAKEYGEQLTITWFQAPSYFQPSVAFTFQVVLDKSGVFEITYDGLPENLIHSPDEDPYESVWFVGAVPGDSAHPPQQVSFSDVPLRADSAGLVQDYYMGFRRYLHQLLAPLAYLILIALLVTAGFPWLLHRSLVQPLNALLQGLQQVNAGNRAVQVPMRSRDEIGFLTESFNTMVTSLRAEQARREQAASDLRALAASLEARVTDRTRDLSALYDVAAIAGRASNLESLLNESLARTMKALECPVGAILLMVEKQDAAEPTRLRIVAHRGFPPGLPLDRELAPSTDGLFATLREQRQPVLVADLSTDSRVPAAMRALGARALMLAPLQGGEHFLGAVELLREVGQGFQLEEIALLATISDQIGVAVQSHRLRQVAQQSALLEERQRLARDLHDSVTQSLYGVVTLAEGAQAQLEAGKLTQTSPIFARIGETARQAVREMRLFIHQLRPDMLQQEGLVGALRLRLAAVEGRSDVRAQLLADETIHLPAALTSALYRIAQEALNNALRHARAESVMINLRREGDRVILEVVDDGCGFDAETMHPGGVGLSSMRELAAEIGGQLQIISAPGAGTTVRVAVRSEEQSS